MLKEEWIRQLKNGVTYFLFHNIWLSISYKFTARNESMNHKTLLLSKILAQRYETIQDEFCKIQKHSQMSTKLTSQNIFGSFQETIPLPP